ncbi:MAG: hypothetical protein PHU85_04005 [Phycisphaerae bacterium]|nr:hypothetical protein [Phycisphaerae bacterium]
MTTLERSPEFERIDAALRFVAGRWWWVNLAQRALVWLAATGLLLAALAAAAGFINLSGNARVAMLATLIGLPAIGLTAFVIIPLRRRLTPQQAARQIEQNVAGLQNRFINAVQLAGQPGPFEPELVRRAICEISKSTSGVPVDRAVATDRLRWSAAAAGGVGILIALFIVFGGGRFAYGLGRLMHPASQSWTGKVRIDEVRPGDVPGQLVKSPLLAGDKLTIEATVSCADPLPREPEAKVWIRKDGQKDFAPFAMRARRSIGRGSLEGMYYLNLPAVEASFDYYVSIGDTNQRDTPLRVNVRQAPQVAGLAVRPIYPEYLKYEQPADPQSDGNIKDAPAGTTAAIAVKMNRPVVSAEIAVAPSDDAAGVAIAMDSPDRSAWTGKLPLVRPMQYRLVFRDESGKQVGAWPCASTTQPEAEAAAFFTATTRPDYPPNVSFIRPGQDAMVKPGGSTDLIVQATDDHGLSSLRLMVAKVKGDASDGEANSLATEPPAVRHAWSGKELLDPKGNPRKLAKITYTFNLGDKYAKGDKLVYWAETADNRNLNGASPQSAASPRFVITVQDPAEIAAAQKKLLEELTAELLALLKEQTDVRGATVGLVRHEPSTQPQAPEDPKARFVADAAAVRKGQSAFADHLLRLAKGLILKFDLQTKPVQTGLMVLAYNDSADAKALADGLAAIADAAAATDPVKKLVARQDRVIYALQSLLGLIGAAEKRTEQASTRPDGSDLPPDVRDKWKKLAEDLEKFIEQQKKDIATTASLAKKPVDDFTKEDELKLAELAANQEKWEKFLDDKLSDFSKVAEQDFSNPALLKELLELKTDVVMAKDALKKKATEIAVPLEEAGLELAEAMTTHIEKWLPDTPDREKWSMEEPTDQQDVPMAELPKELEDMVGELMEEEEDLFDEVEDATSKWTDSLDKGAGWDAADGPISNMSAQGVTGNRLPNTSEISGRSGEGRTGKSSGEMVENEATGKGGRNTPTRLSGDPFQKGQVKDSSKEPPGGATGGGKVSGVAGEGLEGPVPPDLKDKLQRLANKQAAIRNKAEAVDAKFRVNNFNNFGLEMAITLMRRTEMDLQNYRYQNALRKKPVLVGNLQAERMLLRGDIHVQADTSPELLDVQRKDVRAIDENDLPPRFKELAKEYLKSLSETAPNK